ncbi:hypothetical protein V8C86DRAFT_3030862, partial [Haematococcus lacustris]
MLSPSRLPSRLPACRRPCTAWWRGLQPSLLPAGHRATSGTGGSISSANSCCRPPRQLTSGTASGPAAESPHPLPPAPPAAAPALPTAGSLPGLPSRVQAGLPPGPQEQEAAGLQGVDPLCGPYLTKPLPPSVLSVTVHKADSLRPDALVTSPVVRLHVMDPASGDYLRNLVQPGQQLDAGQQAMMLRFPGRPLTVTQASRSLGPGAPPVVALQEYLPAVQTRPYNLLTRPDPVTEARWGEVLMLDEALERLLASDALLLFELLQLPPSFHRYNKHPDQFPGGAGGRAAAGCRAQRPAARAAEAAAVRVQEGLEHTRSHFPLPLPGQLREGVGPDAAAPLRAFTSWQPTFLSPSKACTHQAHTPPCPVTLSTRPAPPPALHPQALMSSRKPGGLSMSSLVPKALGALYVSVDQAPRPPPSLHRTDPSRGLRPLLPAGYGSGFEEGSQPLAHFLAAAFGSGSAGPGGQAGLGGGPGGRGQAALEASRYFRPKTEACKSRLPPPLGCGLQLPNLRLHQLAPGPGGACCAAFSPHSSLLAVAAAGDMRGSTCHLLLYDVLSGAEAARLHHAHLAWVHCLVWSADGSALGSASADGTAKVWELSRYEAAERSLRPLVLRHPCFVYALAFHPNQGTTPLCVTGAHDGVLRVWHRHSGQLLSALSHEQLQPTATSQPVAVPRSGAHINVLQFDNAGNRLWVGDSLGSIQELALDSAAAAAAAASPAAHGKGSEEVDSAAANTQPAAASPRLAGRGEQRPPPGPPKVLLRAVRHCPSMAGESIAGLALNPSGRKLLLLTRASHLATLDTKDFKEAFTLGSVRCSSSLLKPCFSADGALVVAGGEDGRVCAWAAEGSAPLPLPQASLLQPQPHPVTTVAWCPDLHMVAVCGRGSWAPLLLLVHDPDQPPLQAPQADGLRGQASRGAADAALQRKLQARGPGAGQLWGDRASSRRARFELVDPLTPSHVHALLASVRADARKRGLLKTPATTAIVTDENDGGHTPDWAPSRDQRSEQSRPGAQLAPQAGQVLSQGQHLEQQPNARDSPPPSSQGARVDGSGVQTPARDQLPIAAASPTSPSPSLRPEPRFEAAASGTLTMQPAAGAGYQPKLSEPQPEMAAPEHRLAGLRSPGSASAAMRAANSNAEMEGAASGRQPAGQVGAADYSTGGYVGQPRPQPVHEMPEVAGGARWSGAVPPQSAQSAARQYDSPTAQRVGEAGGPFMLGPGATVIAGPGATIVTRAGTKLVVASHGGEADDAVPPAKPYRLALDDRLGLQSTVPNPLPLGQNLAMSEKEQPQPQMLQRPGLDKEEASKQSKPASPPQPGRPLPPPSPTAKQSQPLLSQPPQQQQHAVVRQAARMRLQRPHSVPHTSQQLLPREVHRRARPAASHCPRAQPLSTSNMRRRGSIAQAVEDEAAVASPATAPSGSAQGATRGGQGTAAPQLQLDRWAFTSTLAVSGAGEDSAQAQGHRPRLGTLLDGIHSRVGLQQYDWMPLQLGGLATSAAVPPLLAMFYCVVGALVLAADAAVGGEQDPATAQAAARSSDVTWVAISFGVLAAQLQLSAWAYASGAPLDQLTALLAA